MKRFVALLLVLCLALCACGKSAEAPTEPSDAAIATNPPTDPVEVTDAPTEPEPTEPEVIYRHPLTGEIVDAPFTTRIVASTVNNVPVALPQYGISPADILYEIETEGAATRALALFTDLSEVDALGSVRSARTYFNSIMRSYDGVLTHVGASDEARGAQHDPYGNRLSDWAHIDWGVHAKYSYRDQGRLNAGYAWEHCLFTNGENITAAMSEMGLDTPIEHDYGLQFSETPELNGESATTVAVYFDGGKDTTMVYDAETGLYFASQYGEPWIDAGKDDLQLSFRNVLILKADRIRPYSYNSFYYLEGEGEGYFACDGQLVKILWHRENVDAPFSYTLEDGTPITLGVGKSYIAITTPNCEPVYS